MVNLHPSEVEQYLSLRVPDLERNTSREWRARCPIHGGERNSFSANRETGRWKCHSKCDRGGDLIDLERALTGVSFHEAKENIRRLVGRIMVTPPTQSKAKGRESLPSIRRVCRYEYTDENGKVIFWVDRCQTSDGFKTFYQSRPTGASQSGTHALPPHAEVRGLTAGKYIKQTSGDGSIVYRPAKTGDAGETFLIGECARVPYRLPAVLAAETVFLVEGEKDVHTLEEWGLTASCNPGGSGSSRLYGEWGAYFDGRHLVVLPDNDLAGRRHGFATAESLLLTAKSIRVLELPGLPEKGDVSDWKASGGTKDRFLTLVESCRPLDADALSQLCRSWGLNGGAPNGSASPATVGSFPYEVSDQGVFWRKENSDEAERVLLSARVDVIAQVRDPESNNWGRLLRWHDNDGRKHEWIMPMGLLATDAGAVRQHLLDNGLSYLAQKSGLRERFAEYLQTAPAEARARVASRTGWNRNSFVLPDTTIGPEEAEPIVFAPGHEAGQFWREQGTTEEWREHIGRRCAGNSRLILAVSCAFAGPILGIIGAECGGVHFYGQTSTGKSTTLWVGGSVLGGGPSGFIQTWRATTNGLEAIAEAHNDAALFLDELAQVDPREAAETAYMLGNGQGKARMARSLTARRKATWRVMFVSSGEITLADHAASAGKRTKGGVEVRLLNVEADAGAGLGAFENLHGAPSADVFSRELKDAATRYYGAPFREFIRWLVRNVEAVGIAVREIENYFSGTLLPANAAGELSRAARRFAIIGAAGELASGAGVTGWEKGEALNAAKRCLEEWVDARGTVGSSDLAAAVQQVRAFLEVNGAYRFQDCSHDSEEGERPIPNRAGYRRRRSDTGDVEYLIFRDVFRKEVCEGHDYKQVQKELARLEFLRRDGEQFMVKERLPGAANPRRIYCLRASALGEG